MDLKELHSFKMSDAVTFHDNLNSKLFRGQHLQPAVELQLKTIAQDFLQEMGIHDLDVRDITVSGSNAAYSYTDHSDLDLHILVNMKDLPDDDVYREFFKAKKDLYNDSHDITINGIPVELYIQDASEPVTSLGEYSVKDKKWLRLPTKRRANFDQTATKAKYEKLLDIIDTALHSDNMGKVNKILKKIKQYRQAGLDKGGEFGPENLAYKALRSRGYITKLYDLRDRLHSKHLSLNGMYSNVNEADLDESIRPGPYRIGKMLFDIRNHAIERLEERNVPISTAGELLRRLSTMPNKIRQMPPHASFWVYDETLGISLGMRVLDSGKVQWSTSIIGKPYSDDRNPIVNLSEASGYIPSEKQKNDPRFSTALTVDVKPDSTKKNAKAFYWNTSRAGIPPTAKPSGKI